MKPSLRLRPVTREDCRLLWEWANDPTVRASSFSTAPIPWEDHVRWFEVKLRDEHCTMFIALNETAVPVGQIRFDIREDGNAEVDVHIAPGARGRGYGTALITEGIHTFLRSSDAKTVHSFIKINNAGSRNAFLKAGFKELEREVTHGEEVYHFLYERP
ncbi:MAG TPA: hypothetical protein DEB30_00390 [Candidatus Peribacter riflensis]|uniref:N-acetyltransferase GCN5 n=1 Tax=Candidatus Peribacter riflensis TaxID=1735162 RepID=A0A0S1SQC3_9BACT|nr:MAG: N-acetyltransferase GCN5 [Candidatus Peribacter riflensis]OGJ78487.1 MAG: hypothetical protein A2398_02490 [Candidatus Peribacteria bacterium RIFOXYB1_FULL_57_12]OGJ82269.1 MAG: hypothetical protein A2412_02650 [Candidatus Peribacteria bacterium RIFOXYC1_FULL_58_8]ALM11424.1 MAG: N-acetyltransferase GCN5 [Candidatus Peribacter riflensis]ALM12526.1 MAG: N-acetyltransferase GCN5 [Candidatus Peribacter riflensis]